MVGEFLKKSLGLVAVLAAASMALTGCSGSTATPSATFVKGSALVIGEAGPLANLNSGVYAAPNTTAAEADLAQLTLPAFYGHDATGALVANTAFGSVTAIDANSVEYKLAGAAKWSDGVPVSPADLALSFLAATDAGQPGFVANARFGSLALADKITVATDSVTVHWPTAVPADYQTTLQVTAPAHLVGSLALGGSATAAEGEQAVIDAATGASTDKLSKLEETYATSFATDSANPGKAVKAKYLLSAGPYNYVSANTNTVVLKANTGYSAGPKPAVENVTLRFYNSPDDLVAAISAKEVDLAAPVASGMNNLAQISDLAKKAGMSAVSGDSGQNEVVLLNYNKTGVFNLSTWKGNALQLETAKQMWFDFLPRAGIWSTLAGDKALSKTDSLVLSSTQAGYQASVDKNGSAAYQFQDAELSEQIWLAAKFDRTIKLRVLFDSGNSRGQLEYTQIARLGKLGGFDLRNNSTDNPASVLATGDWDVYITTMGRLASDPTAQALLSGALAGYSNDAVNAILASVPKGSTLAQQPKLLAKLDAALYANHFALPLFQLNNLVVSSSKLVKYQANPANSSVVWGYSNWSVSGTGK